MARDPVKISKDLDDNALANPIEVIVGDGTENLLVNADGSVNATINNAAGASAVNIQDGGNSITVDGSVTVSATDLDIRDLSETTDHVLVFANTAKDGTGTDYVPLVDADGHLQVDILSGATGGTEYNEDDATPATIVGKATLVERDDALSTVTPVEGDWIGLRGNARGALWVELDPTNSVSIDDNGGSLTIDNSTLAVVGGGTEATALRVTIASDSTGVLSVDDNGGSLTVDATQLDIDDLNDTDDKVAIGDGTDTLAINTDGSINVVTQSTSGTPQISTNESSLGSGASDNHTVTASGGTLEPGLIQVSSESIATFEILAGASGGPTSYGKVRTSVEHPNAEFRFPDGFTVADTEVIRVTRTNDSNKTKDVNSTISSYQN